MDLAQMVLGVASLMAFASLTLPIARGLGAPYTVLLALLGVATGALAILFPAVEPGIVDAVFDLQVFGLGDEVEPDLRRDVWRAIGGLIPSSETFIYVFLPPLLFSAGLSVDVRRLFEDIAPVVALAVVAVGASALAIGLALAQASQFGLAACLLVGAIVATTDPSAVIAIFRETGAPRRLVAVVEGESLFNDAAAIALFAALLPVVAGGVAPDAAAAVGGFVGAFLGGLATGFLGGRLVCSLMGRGADQGVVEITLTVALAYLSFVIAEDYLGVSGVVATVAAAIAIGASGRSRVAPSVWRTLVAVWDQLGFWANALVFSLAAMLAPRLLQEASIEDAVLLGVLIAAALGARAVVLFVLIPLGVGLGIGEPIEARRRLVIWWGALRGGVTLALALAVTEHPGVDDEVQRFVGVMATGFVLFTLFVKALTLRPLIRALGLDALSPEEEAVRDRVAALSQREARARAATLAETLGADASDLAPAEEATEPPDAAAFGPEQRVKAGLLALAAREGELALESHASGLAPRAVVDLMRADAERLADGANDGGREGYEAAAARALEPRLALRLALWAHRRLGVERPLAEALARRIERLTVLDLGLRELEAFEAESVRPFLGPATSDELRAVLARRLAATRAVRAALETQYPRFAEELRRRYVMRAALRAEEAHYRLRHREGLISAEIFKRLIGGVAERRAGLGSRPPLDLGLRLREMMARSPLLADLNDAAAERLARALRPALAMPGERVIRRGERGDAMYFLVAGQVSVEGPGLAAPIALGPGELFGEIALVQRRPRTADVVAREPCQLLKLAADDFWRFLRSEPELRARIEEIAKTRSDSLGPGD